MTSTPRGEVAGERVRELKEAEQRARESHLRSSEEVIGYRLVATDGPAGHVEDFIIDDSDWRITDIVIDTRSWLSGDHLRLPTDTVAKVDWATREVRLKIPRAEVEKAIEDRFPGSSVTVHMEPCDGVCTPVCVKDCLLGEAERRDARRGGG